MANISDQFKKNVIGSKSKINDYTSIISSNGDFKRISNFSAVLNAWNNILLTPVGTYDHDPEYGSNLHKYVYEPLDNETAEGIQAEIRRSLASYNNQATISKINVTFLKDGKGFSVDIMARYGTEQDKLTINVDEASAFNVL